MKITVTGSAGKLGQWVVRTLLEARGGEAHEVTAFDRASGPEQPGVRALAGDVEDLGQVCGAVAGADAIIHLAAIARPNVAPDDVTFRTNVVGAYNVHEAAYLLGVRRLGQQPGHPRLRLPPPRLPAGLPPRRRGPPDPTPGSLQPVQGSAGDGRALVRPQGVGDGRAAAKLDRDAGRPRHAAPPGRSP